MRLLLVDDDAGLRALLRATFDVFEVDIDEAENAAQATQLIDGNKPDAIVLDVHMPGESGIELCRRLKRDPRTRAIPVVLLTGSVTGIVAGQAGSDAVLTKPFSPLELLAVVERLVGGLYGVPFRAQSARDDEEQLVLYARDLRHLLEIERGQRGLLEDAYRDTVVALTSALESKDMVTRAHSQRVQQYAVELSKAMSPELLREPSTEYGFLLHDVGKIGIPDKVLGKPAKLTAAERRLMQTHTVLGEQMLGGVSFLRGECTSIVRSHHERWDGAGYPDGLDKADIPLGARIFAVADALDAITSDRPYRPAQSWQVARDEIMRGSGLQFDPIVVEAFLDRDADLHEIHHLLAA
jgi:response regulator RpfG family c-di-GMP phosphodiesterase